MAIETKPLQLDLSCHEMIEKVKKETKLPKKYVVETAIKIAYAEILKKEEN